MDSQITQAVERLDHQFCRLLGRPVATVSEAAHLVARHPNTIRAAVRSGDLQAVQADHGDRILIRTAALATWLLASEKSLSRSST